MSYEDSFEREAKDERAYRSFEHRYIYENLKPETIGKWEWDLMFDRNLPRYVYSKAASDAVEMARELGLAVIVEKLYEGCWIALPVDYYKTPEGFYGFTYAVKRGCFIEALVLEGKYPDIVALANAMDHKDKHSIFLHSLDEREAHQRWRQNAAGS